MDEELGLFAGKSKPDFKIAWDMYQRGLTFMGQLNLFDTIRSNRNFYIGKQWEGVSANGLPTPVFNIMKRVVGFITASLTTDNLRAQVTLLENMYNKDELQKIVDAVNAECAAIMENCEVTAMVREYARNAAIDGSSCIYVYWDPDVPVGDGIYGAVKAEIIQAENVIFGDANSREVQSQPYIQIARRELVRSAKLQAKKNGSSDWKEIMPDSETSETLDSVKRTDDKVTILLTMWKDDETGEVWAYESTQTATVRKPWKLGIKMYPICWLCWDYVQDCYLGEAMITGLIPNQIFINKAWAMSMLSIMRTAWPKIVYDKTKVRSWDNRVGGAIGVPGNVEGVAKIIDPAAIDPQVSQLIKLAVEQTEQSLGATAVALGDTRPDNTSAIIALQRAAATPSELTKRNIYCSVEDFFRICIDFMTNFYGVRMVDMPLNDQTMGDLQMLGVNAPAEIPQPFDFGILKEHPLMLKLDVGASSFYSETAAMQTLDNLLMNNRIETEDYLERIPDDYMPAKRALLDKIRQRAQQQAMMAGMIGGPEAPEGGGESGALMATEENMKPEVTGGGGYKNLQRAINSGGNY